MTRLVEKAFLIALTASGMSGQRFELAPVEPVTLNAIIDSNTPVFWRDGRFHIFSSAGLPMLTSGEGPLQLQESTAVFLGPGTPDPLWIESVWKDEDETLFLWYHHEVVGLCGDKKLSMPKIGAAVSYDGGRSLTDLGFVLEDRNPVDCSAENGYFGGGHGDFSVIYNPADQHFYFFFSSYGGDVSEQGVAVARMHVDARYAPGGSVWKYHQGKWDEPGLGGWVTPVFPAKAAWQREDADSYWGPSIHWNSYLEQWVILMNRSCCVPGWPQAGVYITFNPDLSQPDLWRAPELLIAAGDWYPQVIGSEPGESDRLAGRQARLFVRGFSDWEIVFHRDDPDEESVE